MSLIKSSTLYTFIDTFYKTIIDKIDKYNIPKFVDNIDFIGIGIFTCISFINYRHKKEELKINELIQSNKQILDLLNKHNQILEDILQKSNSIININDLSDNISEISNTSIVDIIDNSPHTLEIIKTSDDILFYDYVFDEDGN
jgi:hypothetical protein